MLVEHSAQDSTDTANFYSRNAKRKPSLEVAPTTLAQRIRQTQTTHSNGPVLFCSLASVVVVVVVCRRLSGFITLHGRPAAGFSCTGQAMTSCRLQSTYSSTVTLYDGPVRLRPVRATPCLYHFKFWSVLFLNFYSPYNNG